MKLSTFYNKFYSLQVKMSPKEPNTHLFNMTRSQLLEGPKCESQIEDSGRARSWGTLFGSQHFRKVEGHARAPGWDKEK
jgi:hypothetical protein